MESARQTIENTTPCACGEVAAELRERGPHVGAYCVGCGTHQRWVPKSELGLPTRSVRSRPRIAPKVRQRVLDRFGYSCITCGRTSLDVMLHVDHIIPVDLAKRHGLYDELIESELNLAPSCEECNLGKGAEVFSVRTMRLMIRCLRLAEVHAL